MFDHRTQPGTLKSQAYDEALRMLEAIIADGGAHKSRALTVPSSALSAIPDALFERLDEQSAQKIKQFFDKTRLATHTNRTIDARCETGAFIDPLPPAGIPGLLDLSTTPAVDATPLNAPLSPAAKLLWIRVNGVDDNGEIGERTRIIDLIRLGYYGPVTERFLADYDITVQTADDRAENEDPFAKPVLIPLDDSQTRYIVTLVAMPSALGVSLNEAARRQQRHVAQRVCPTDDQPLRVQNASTKAVLVGFTNCLVESTATKFQNVTPITLLAGGLRHRPVYRLPSSDATTRERNRIRWQRTQAAHSNLEPLAPLIAQQVRNYGGPARQVIIGMRASGGPVTANASMRRAAFDIGVVAAAACQQVLAPADAPAVVEAAKPDAIPDDHQAIADQIGTLATRAVAEHMVMTDDHTDPLIGVLIEALRAGVIAGLEGQTTETAPGKRPVRRHRQTRDPCRIPTAVRIRLKADRVDIGSNAPTVGLPSLTAIFSLIHCVDRHLASQEIGVRSRAFRPVFRAIRSPQIDRHDGYGEALFMSVEPPHNVWSYLGDEPVNARYRAGASTTQHMVSGSAKAIAPPFRADVRGSVDMEILVRYTGPTDEAVVTEAIGKAIRRANLAGGHIRPESVRVQPMSDEGIKRLHKGFGLRAETDFPTDASPDEILDTVMASHTYIHTDFINDTEGDERYQNASRFGRPLGLIHVGYRLLDTTFSTARRDRQDFPASRAEPVWQTISSVRSGSDEASWWEPDYDAANQLWRLKPVTQ